MISALQKTIQITPLKMSFIQYTTLSKSTHLLSNSRITFLEKLSWIYKVQLYDEEDSELACTNSIFGLEQRTQLCISIYIENQVFGIIIFFEFIRLPKFGAASKFIYKVSLDWSDNITFFVNFFF